MGRYATIKSDVYEDKAFEELSVNGKFLYLYLLSCPYCNYIGYYYLNPKKAAIDTGLSEEEVIAELTKEREKPLWMYDEKESQVLVLNYLKHNKVKSVKQIKGIEKQIITYSASPLLPHFVNQVRLFVTENIAEIFGEDTARKLEKLT